LAYEVGAFKGFEAETEVNINVKLISEKEEVLVVAEVLIVDDGGAEAFSVSLHDILRPFRDQPQAACQSLG